MAATVLFAFSWALWGPFGLLFGFVTLFAVAQALVRRGFVRGAFQAPRSWLPIHHRAELDKAPIAPGTQQPLLRSSFRHCVAVTECAGGIGVLFLAFTLKGYPVWYAMALESLGLLSIVGGIWLWQDKPLGYELTRALLWLQLVRIQSPNFAYAVTSGFYLDIYDSGEIVGIAPGLLASFLLRFDAKLPVGIAVNVWAATLLTLIPKRRDLLSVHFRSVQDRRLDILGGGHQGE